MADSASQNPGSGGLLEYMRACPDCGLFSILPENKTKGTIRCPRCQKIFRARVNRSLDHTLAYAIAGVCFCIILATAPFMEVSLYGRHHISTLWTGADILNQERLWPLGYVVILTMLILPVAKLTMLSTVLLALKLKKPPRRIVNLFRWIKRISPWAMLEVYLLGLLVAYTRLQQMVYVHIDLAVYALIGTILAMAAADATLDSEEVWEQMRQSGLTDEPEELAHTPLIGCDVCFQATHHLPHEKCPRCRARLHPRKSNSLTRAWAFVIAAAIFYIPANYFPVMHITKLARNTPHTIIGGMLELVHAGLWPLGVLVFVASIAIPLVKIFSLSYLLITTGRRSHEHLCRKLKLYRVIEFIGRWSMVDIFMVSILVALIQFGQFAEITSDIGAICFAMVVIMTMIAVESFDPRLMWDKAGENAPT